MRELQKKHTFTWLGDFSQLSEFVNCTIPEFYIENLIKIGINLFPLELFESFRYNWGTEDTKATLNKYENLGFISESGEIDISRVYKYHFSNRYKLEIELFVIDNIVFLILLIPRAIDKRLIKTLRKNRLIQSFSLDNFKQDLQKQRLDQNLLELFEDSAFLSSGGDSDYCFSYTPYRNFLPYSIFLGIKELADHKIDYEHEIGHYFLSAIEENSDARDFFFNWVLEEGKKLGYELPIKTKEHQS